MITIGMKKTWQGEGDEAMTAYAPTLGGSSSQLVDDGIEVIAPGVPLDVAASAVGSAEVIERYQNMVYAICLTHTRCRSDADDVFQEVFLTYHRKQPVCADEEHRKAWLIRTTLMVARRVATSTWRARVVPLPDDELDGPPEVFRFDELRYDELFRALSGLPENYRSVIHLFYFEDLPVAQIAAVLKCTVGTVKMRLKRGRTILRQALTKEDSNV